MGNVPMHFRVIGRVRLHHEYPLDPDSRVPLCRDRCDPSALGTLYFHPDVEQGV